MIFSFLKCPLWMLMLLCMTCSLNMLQATPRGKKRLLCEYQKCHKYPVADGLCKAHGLDKRCAVEDCVKLAMFGGRCVAHGGGKRCTAENCRKSAQSRGLCFAHGGGQRCQLDGCQKAAKSGGLCFAHGGKPKSCDTEGCSRIACEGGLCFAHGGGFPCRVENCGRSARSNGLCVAHGGRKPCQFEGCAKSAQLRGLCVVHGGGRRCASESCRKFALQGGRCRAHGGGKRCRIEECESLAKSGGLCVVHGGGPRCEIDNCGRPALSKKRCFVHGGGRRCGLAACNKMVSSNGLCYLHAKQERRVAQTSFSVDGVNAVEFAVGGQEMPAEVVGASLEQPYGDLNGFLGLEPEGAIVMLPMLEFAPDVPADGISDALTFSAEPETDLERLLGLSHLECLDTVDPIQVEELDVGETAQIDLDDLWSLEQHQVQDSQALESALEVVNEFIAQDSEGMPEPAVELPWESFLDEQALDVRERSLENDL